MDKIDKSLSDTDLEKFLRSSDAKKASNLLKPRLDTSRFLPKIDPAAYTKKIVGRSRSLGLVWITAGALTVFSLGLVSGFVWGKKTQLNQQIEKINQSPEDEIIEPIEELPEEEQLAPKSPA